VARFRYNPRPRVPSRLKLAHEIALEEQRTALRAAGYEHLHASVAHLRDTFGREYGAHRRLVNTTPQEAWIPRWMLAIWRAVNLDTDQSRRAARLCARDPEFATALVAVMDLYPRGHATDALAAFIEDRLQQPSKTATRVSRPRAGGKAPATPCPSTSTPSAAALASTRP
jgi:hypothetical protein